MSITFPELDTAVGQLNLKRKDLHDIFTEAGPEMDMAKVKSLTGDSAAKVEQIRTINAEIDILAKKVEDLTIVLKGAENGADYTEDDPSHETGGGGKGPQRTKSVGEQFVDEAGTNIKRFKTDLDLDLKVLMSTAAGFAPEVTRGPRIVEFATMRPTILDFIPTTTTTQSAVAYMEETTFTNNAVEVGEGLVKPEAALAFTPRTSLVRKIAVFLPVTDEQLEDVPRLKQYIDNRLGLMVRQRLASQVLVGTGAGITLRGFLSTVGIQTQAKGADPTPDAVYKAMTLVRTVGMAEPDAAIFNALDWQDVRLLRTVDGIYIWGSPAEAGPERIWGLPVVIDSGLTQNTALVGAFGGYTELAMRKGLTVETGYNGNDWTMNIQTIRAELRAALLVYRPTALCSVTGV